MARLVGDRKAEVRRAACQALHLVYTRMDGPTLLPHIAHASPPDQVSLSCSGPSKDAFAADRLQSAAVVDIYPRSCLDMSVTLPFK